MAKRRPPKPSMRVKDGRRQPFTWFPNELIREHGAAIGPYAGWVYMALLTHANKEGVCWPAHETLAAMTGMSTRHVKRSLKRLESLGLISVTMRRPKTSVYTILEVPEAPVNRPMEPITNEAPNGSASPINRSGSPINGSASPIEWVPQSYEVDVLEVEPPNQNHSTTSSPTPPSPTLSAPVSPPAAVAADDFWEVWRAYPKHDDIDRARVEYHALAPDPELRRTILDDIAAKRQHHGGRFLPKYLADYLHNQKWLDAKPEAPSRPSWLTEDEAPAPVDPLTCKDPDCEDPPGRYSRKWCDAHALPQLQEEARKVADILRLAYSPDDPAMQLALERCVTSYHEPEPAADVLYWILDGWSPGAPQTEAELLELICKRQEVYVAMRRDVEAAKASRPTRKIELVI